MDGFFLQQNANVVGSRESAAFQCGPPSSLRAEPSPSSAVVVVDKAENDTGLPNHVGLGDDTIYLTADGNGEVHLGYLEGTSGEAEATVDDSRRRRKTFTMRDPREESHHRLPPLGEVESGDDSDCVVVASSERKVEPLKINLARDREPIRTIIKLTPGVGSVVDHHSSCSQPLSPTIREVPGSPKITIKPPKAPPSLVEGGGSSSSTSSGGGGVGLHQNSNSDMSQPATATTVMSSSSSSSSSRSSSSSSNSSSSSSIPKLTIKPVINPTEELLTVEGPAEQMQIIPKLLIKGSSLDATAHGPTEPHIVPKLTIRGVNNHNHHLHHHHHLHQQQQQQQQQQQHQQHQQHPSHYQHHPFAQISQESSQHYSTTGNVVLAASSPNDGSGLLVAGGGVTAAGSPTTPSTPLVPKLTIKMDNHHPHHHHHVQQTTQHHNSLRVTVDSGGLESPIPKLHIRAILPEAGGGSSSVQSPPSSSLGMATAGTSGTNSLTSSEGVKLTIKPLPEPPKLPKLTIKTTGLGTIAETSDASLVSSTSCSFSPKLLPAGGAAVSGSANSHELHQHHHHHPMHLLTVAQQQPASPSDQHSNISSSSIPKLTIKPFSPKIAGVGQQQQQQSPTGSGQTSTAMGSPSMGGGDLQQVVPKLTIKPIPAPPKAMKQSTGEDSNSFSETSINSLESSPVSSSSSSSPQAPSAVMTTSPSALRMTIKVPPAQDAHSVGGSTVTISGVQTSSSSAGTVVTKLNIKPILPPPTTTPITREGGVDGVQNREAIVSGDGGDSSPPSEAEMDPSAAPIVIPKVTIKTLAHPRGQETEILSTPKVTLRPIPKPMVHDIGLPPGSPGVGQPATEWHSPQAASGTPNSNNSPTAGMTASDGGGSMDSPRIILKINKGSSSTTTSMEQQQQQQSSSMSEGRDMTEGIPTPPSAISSILANELKRPATTTAAPLGVSNTAFSSASSSSLSSTSSTTVSISTSSSSAGSDPASPSSSAGGGDQGDPGSPEAKKSKLDSVGAMPRIVAPQQPFINSDHNAALRQSLLLNHQQQQQQLQKLQKAHQQQKAALTSGMTAGQSATVSDVIVIDDDSKSENESMRGEGDQVMIPMVPAQAVGGQQLQQESGNFLQQPFYPLLNNNEATVTTAAGRAIKPRRTRGTPRGTAARGAGGGGRQSRRGATGGGRGAVLLKENSAVSETPRLIPGMLNHDDHEEGSSSDCMIVDDPATTNRPASSATVAVTPVVRTGGLSLESLLLGSGSKQSPSLYNATTITGGAGAGSGEVEKNGTASNSSIGSVSSSIGGGIVTTPAPPATTTPGVTVRMSTRRGAGQLLKEVLANKHHDRDSGVDDEAKTDGEGGLHGGPTPSKRPRGRPKKQSVDLTTETTNGGGSSSSMDGNGAPDSNMMMALAMMGGGGGEGGTSFLRPEGPGMLGSQSLMEGIMPLPITPVRTPRTRGRGRGRGRGKLSLLDSTIVAQSPTLDAYDATRRNFALPSGIAASEGNGDPLFIDATTAATNFNLLFNHVQTPRGGVRTRGGRRGTGARGARTPRGGGRGASKAARAAAVALLDSTPGPDALVNFLAPAGVSPEVAMGDPLQLPTPGLSPSGVSPPTAETPAGPKGRGRAARGAGAASKRKEPPSSKKAPRGKKAQEAAALLAAASLAAAELSPMTNVTDSSGATNTIFMTPMAGGLDFNRPKLHVRELKTPRNAVKSNTPPSSAQTTPLASTTPTGTPGELTPGGGLQVFEEDTRMSGDFNFTTPVRLMMGSGDGCLQPNEESQSSYLSSTSITQDATTIATISSSAAAAAACAIGGQPQLGGVTDGVAPESASTDAQKEALAGAISSTSNSSSSTRRPTKGKMEVLDAHRAAFTVDLLAEYEWPPPSPGTRGTDTFMLQEQIAEYLGVKSFKRKYPDLMRRPVDMEERNFLLEQGLASEKMCDLGLTAVYASEILDIMCTDYPEKYEEYTRYTREKHFRELSNRQQRQQQEAASAVAAVAAAPIDRVQLQKEKAIESASSWNCSFNRERRDMRRACMDLQTYVVQVPKRFQPSFNQAQSATKSQEPSNYPVALVPGQFSEYYTTFTPEELACYPINTILLDPVQMREIVSSERYRKLVAEEEARLRASVDDDGSSSSDDDSDTGSSSSSDEDEDGSSSDSSSSSNSNSSTTSSARSSCADSDDCGSRNIKKELDRRKRTDLADGEKNDECEEKASTSASSVGGPVRRSSRALSAGTVAPPSVVEIKEPTDSDDSDVPLIAHAVRRKNLLLAGGAIANTTTHPSAGGGKRMQETLTPVKRPPVNPFMCAVCLGPENKNKYTKPERFVRCNRCRRKAHPSCIGMSSVMYRRVQQYKWQCSECKLCMKCNRSPASIDSKMVYCDQCDRGYHLACKGLRNLPEGRWHCSLCTICGQCGARTPEGHPNPHLNAQQRQHLAMVAEWTHEYGLNDLTKIREHLRTLCVPCVRIRRQRLQQPDQTSPNATVTAGNGETKPILNNNNNNNNNLSNHLKQQQGVGATGAAVVAVKKSQSHLMMHTSNIKQQPHTTVVVQTGSGLPNSHLPGGTKGPITGEVRR